MESVHAVQCLSVPPRWRYEEHAHRGVEVVGVVRGQVILATLDEQWALSAGQVVVVPPHLSHGWHTDRATTLNILHLTHLPDDLEQRLLPGCQPRLLYVSPAQFAEYDSLFTRMIALAKKTELRQMRLLKARLETFLLNMLEEIQEQEPLLRSVVHRVAAYMLVHLDEPLTVAQLARQFLLSEVTLRRYFRTFFGVSPKQYLLVLRLEEAQQLLLTSHLSMQEVAAQVGFLDLSHFSSTFRRRFGCTPSVWRTHMQSLEPAPSPEEGR